MARNRRWQGRIFLGRDGDGAQQYHWVGRFDTRRERDEAVRKEYVRLEDEGCDCDACVAMGKFQGARGTAFPLIEVQVERYLADYERRNRGSSHDAQTGRLKRFRRELGHRTVDIPRPELKDWMMAEGKFRDQDPVPVCDRAAIVTFYNHQIDEEDLPLPKNPARGLGQRYKGRKDQAPPIEDEFQRLVDSCAVLGDDYAPMMRAVFQFATFQLMRPSELFPLAPSHVDFSRMRVSKKLRLYRGSVDAPKTGEKLIALTPPARDAILPLDRSGPFLFTNKSGGQLNQGSLHDYWKQVRANAGLDFDFYHATKHYGVWFFWVKLGMSDRAIAAQAGWSLRTVTKMLETYGHGDVGALDEVDERFAAAADQDEPRLRIVGGRDANGMQ